MFSRRRWRSDRRFREHRRHASIRERRGGNGNWERITSTAGWAGTSHRHGLNRQSRTRRGGLATREPGWPGHRFWVPARVDARPPRGREPGWPGQGLWNPARVDARPPVTAPSRQARRPWGPWRSWWRSRSWRRGSPVRARAAGLRRCTPHSAHTLRVPTRSGKAAVPAGGR